MHELSLAHSICETSVANCPPGQRLTKVVVEWGPLSGVVPDALEYCFEVVAQSMGLEAVELRLICSEANASCPRCHATFKVDQMWSECPECGHAPVTVTGGREFRLKEIEVEDV